MISTDGATDSSGKSKVSSSARNTKACDECRKKEALYLCPRCSFRSCSLACCKAHKVNRGCNGKRDRAAFARPMTDDILQSDYHFLEDVLGTVDSSKRLLRQVGACTSSIKSTHQNSQQGRSWKRTKDGEKGDERDEELSVQSHHTLLQIQESGGPKTIIARGGGTPLCSHPKWRHFQKQADAKGIQVLYMPSGMERHKSNRSYVKGNTIYWTVEWILYGSTISERQQSTHTTTQALSEDAPLWTEVSKLDPQHTTGSSRLLLKRLPCPSNQPLFVELCDSATLATALKDTAVLEYPTIHVVPLDRLNEFPRAITDVTITTTTASSEEAKPSVEILS